MPFFSHAYHTTARYGTHFFGLNRMHLLMEKQRNRGQDGAGVANVKLDMAPGTKYIHCEKSIAAVPWPQNRFNFNEI